jgi:hypothetical protein
LEAVASVKGLKALYLGDDTGFPRAFAVLRELRGRSGDLPLTVDATFQEFSDKLERHDLPGGVLYRVEGVDNADVANRCMERVRAYRA